MGFAELALVSGLVAEEARQAGELLTNEGGEGREADVPLKDGSSSNLRGSG
jgi:hypothetical protein